MNKLIFISCVLLISITVNAQEMFDAIRNNDLSKVKELVEKDPQLVNARTDNSYTPLFFAVDNDKKEIAEYLISKGADIDFVLLDNYYGITPMNGGIKNGNLEMVKMLHKRGANIQYRTNLGENYLHFAAAHNTVDIAEYLIDSGIDVNSVKNGGLTPLHITAIFGSTDVAKLLVKKGAKLDLKSKDGGTPLHFAVAARNQQIADFLRQSGAKDTPRKFPTYRGKYLGQKVPETEPEPFIPELFRDIYRSYSTPIFTPDGKEVFWYGYFMPRTGYKRIWWMREEKGKWTAPELAPFSDFDQFSPGISYDGNRLYFASKHPVPGKTTTDTDLWYVEKQDGKWSEPRHLNSPPNRDNFNEMLPSSAKDETIYFKAFGPGSRGTRMYKSKRINGMYGETQSIDDLIDSNSEDDCMDIQYIITYWYFTSKYAEISICFHKPDGRWTKPIYMGDKVHQGQGTSNGKISPDGKYFFFVQDISPYWVNASFIEDLRKEALVPKN